MFSTQLGPTSEIVIEQESSEEKRQVQGQGSSSGSCSQTSLANIIDDKSYLISLDFTM